MIRGTLPLDRLLRMLGTLVRGGCVFRRLAGSIANVPLCLCRFARLTLIVGVYPLVSRAIKPAGYVSVNRPG